MELLDRLLQPGKSVILKFSKNGFKGSVHTTVIRSAKEDQLTLLLLDNENLIEHLFPGIKLKLVGHNEEDGHDYHLLTELIEIKPGALPLAVVKRPTEIDHSTRRSFLRLHVNLPFSYYDDFQEKTGEARNLSINGLLALVKSSPLLRQNYSLIGKLVLPEGEPLLIIGKIVRVKKEDSLHSWIALDFQSASEEVKNRISRYLVQRQRHLINLKKKASSNNLSVS